MSQYEPTYDSIGRPPSYGRYVPTNRFNISCGVSLPCSEIDLRTGQVKPERQRRTRTQAARLEREEVERHQNEALQGVNEPGRHVSIAFGAALIVAMLVFGAFCTLLQYSRIAALQSKINRNEAAISEYVQENARLETELAEASSQMTVCYAAANNLDMINPQSAKAIYVKALDTRPGEKSQSGEEQQAAQNTPIPMSASN